MSSDSLISALSEFEKDGLIQHSNSDPKGYVYAPSSNALRDAVDQTAKLYSERRVAVINLIFSTPLKSLSDAFKLRQED